MVLQQNTAAMDMVGYMPMNIESLFYKGILSIPGNRMLSKYRLYSSYAVVGVEYYNF